MRVTVVEIHRLMLRRLLVQILVVGLVGHSELRVDLLFVVIPVVIILVVFIVDLVFVPASWSLGTVRMESGAAKATVRISEVT